MLPPRSSFENWPDCFLQYEEIVFEMPGKMQALDNVSKFRSWMENCVNKVVHFVAVNHENDTCFENGLVMGSAGYSYIMWV